MRFVASDLGLHCLPLTHNMYAWLKWVNVLLVADQTDQMSILVHSTDYSQCWTNTHYYTGETSMTKSGLKCQEWSSQYPHKHGYIYDYYFPDDGGVANASNYCRDPDGTYMPWCYTTDINVSWDWCDIPLCDGEFVCLFDFILYVPSTIFQLYRDGSSWVEPVLS